MELPCGFYKLFLAVHSSLSTCEPGLKDGQLNDGQFSHHHLFFFADSVPELSICDLILFSLL